MLSFTVADGPQCLTGTHSFIPIVHTSSSVASGANAGLYITCVCGWAGCSQNIQCVLFYPFFFVTCNIYPIEVLLPNGRYSPNTPFRIAHLSIACTQKRYRFYLKQQRNNKVNKKRENKMKKKTEIYGYIVEIGKNPCWGFWCSY